jgi:hypothetical protein
MYYLNLTANKFDPNPYWEVPLQSTKPMLYTDTDVFDQNGYDLCSVEHLYAEKNLSHSEHVRNHRYALKQAWMTQEYKPEGAVLNHASLFERKAYTGRALEQLKRWADIYPIYYRLINIRPKWGLDFSMDYYDREGNTFEVLHWEYDGFNLDEVETMRNQVEDKFISIDWDDAAKEILKRKDEWYHLDFFSQSAYKCAYFGICNERWKMVVWT